MRIGLIGGTGKLGHGLARRWAAAGHDVIIGSRDAARAQTSAEELGGSITGASNSDAAAACDVAVLAILYPGVHETMPQLAHALTGKVVLSTIVPLAMRDGRLGFHPPAAGSAAQEIAELLPESRVCAALHSVSASELDQDTPVDGDSIVCGDDEDAVKTVRSLITDLGGLRPVEGGSLAYAPVCEALTSLLLSINKRYRAHSGIRIVGIDNVAQS